MKTNEEQRVKLGNLARGSLEERFDHELNKVLSNIFDLNTSDAAREITIKVKIKPDKERSFCDVQVQTSSKLAPLVPVTTHLYVGKSVKGNVAMEHNPQQMKLEMEPQEEGAKVVPITQKGEGN